MSNTVVNLADLKEGNINQLVASDMLLIRGGCGKKRRSSTSKKFIKVSFTSKKKKHKGHGKGKGKGCGCGFSINS